MKLQELDSFKISDAVTFHDKLNPKLWNSTKLRPEVKQQLEAIADDFLQEMGIHELDVRDITISGSNAAYSYTDHSDLDLHILVNVNDLPRSDVYKELFQAKKTIYNDTHDITIHKVPVELYVQDANEPVVSLGEYSIKNDSWIKIPTKRRSNFDQNATKAKHAKLLDIVERAIESNNLNKIQKVLKKIKQYRQAGLDKGGEFGPENLAYKALRSQGYITKLYDLRDKLHSQHLTIENMYQPIKDEVNEAPVTGNYADLYHTTWTDTGMLDTILQNGKLIPGQNKWLSLTRDSRLDYAKMMGQFAEFVIDQNKLRQRVKLDQYDDFKGRGADEAEERVNVPIPLKGFVKSIHLPASWKHDEKAIQYYEPKLKQYGIPFYYDTMGSREDRNADVPRLEEASGYIPSEKQKNDPRFKTALTVDVKPDSIKKNAKSFYWNTSRAGIPPTANTNGKV
jgi:hypothetical protein